MIVCFWWPWHFWGVLARLCVCVCVCLGLFLKWKYNWFTKLCQSLLYSKVIQLHTYKHSFFFIFFSVMLLQDVEYSSLCYTVGTCCVSILRIIVCTMPLYWNLPDGFLKMSPGLWILGRKIIEANSHFLPHPIRVACYQHDLWLWMLTLITGLRRVCQFSPRWSCSCSLLFSHCALWKEVTVHSHTAGWGVRLPFFEGRKIYVNYLEFFCMKDLSCLLSPFINLFNNLFALVWTHIYLFCIWIICQ